MHLRAIFVSDPHELVLVVVLLILDLGRKLINLTFESPGNFLILFAPFEISNPLVEMIGRLVESLQLLGALSEHSFFVVHFHLDHLIKAVMKVVEGIGA